jgi:hypothetical protein
MREAMLTGSQNLSLGYLEAIVQSTFLPKYRKIWLINGHKSNHG